MSRKMVCVGEFESGHKWVDQETGELKTEVVRMKQGAEIEIEKLAEKLGDHERFVKKLEGLGLVEVVEE